MARIDLVTIVHPDDKRDPKFKYTFKAPAESGIKIDDYVIADIKGKESLGKVVSVLENVDEDSNLMNYIRSVSTIGNQKIKPLDYKLTRTKLEFPENESGDEPTRLPNIEDKKKFYYYSIDQRIVFNGSKKEHLLYVELYEYDESWLSEEGLLKFEEKKSSGNIFFDVKEAEEITKIIMSSVKDDTQFIDIKAELKKIL